MKKTLAIDSCVKTINIEARVTPVKIEYAINNAVAVFIDMELILAEINHTRPSWAKKMMKSTILFEYNNSNSWWLFATPIAVRPEMPSAKVIHKYTFFKIAKYAFWTLLLM